MKKTTLLIAILFTTSLFATDLTSYLENNLENQVNNIDINKHTQVALNCIKPIRPILPIKPV